MTKKQQGAFVDAILTGQLDEILDAIPTAVRQRRDMIGAAKRGSFRPNDRVVLQHSVRESLRGAEGIVIPGGRTKIHVKLEDSPKNRALGIANRVYRCPPASLEKVAA